MNPGITYCMRQWEVLFLKNFNLQKKPCKKYCKENLKRLFLILILSVNKIEIVVVP